MKHKLVKVSLTVVIAILIVSGFAMLVTSYFPGSAGMRINALVSSGSLDSCVNTVFWRTIVQLRYVGTILLLAVVLLLLTIQRVQWYVFSLLSSLVSLSRELWHDVYDAARGEDKIHRCSLFLVFLIGIGVRLLFLSQPMRYDESFTFVNYASKPLICGLSDYFLPNNHLLHTFLVHVTYVLFGNQPWVVRLPAFVAGIFLAPLSYVVTRISYGKSVALLTAGIVATSSAFIEYSVNARGYTLICLIFLLILSLVARLKRDKNPGAWFLFVILSAMGFYTIPIMLYPFGIVVVWLFLSAIFRDTDLRRNSLLKHLFISVLFVAMLTFIFYLPVILRSGLMRVIGNRFVAPRSWSCFAAELPLCLRSIWRLWNRDTSVIVSLTLVVGFCISLIFHKRLARHRFPIALPVVAWCIPALIIQRVVPYARISIFLIPLYIGSACSGLVYLARLTGLGVGRSLRTVVPILAVALSFWLGMNVICTQSVHHWGATDTLRDAETVTLFLKDYLSPGDKILSVSPSDAPLDYYFDLHNVSCIGSPCQRVLLIVDEQRQTVTEVMDQLELSATEYSAPRLVKRLKTTGVYEMKRRITGQERVPL